MYEFKIAIIGYFLGFWFQGTAQGKRVQYKSEYFIILVIDGPRYTETYGDTACTNIPNLCHVLRPEGTFFTNFRNEGSTYTIPGHTALTTGCYERISNLGTNFPKRPSLFQYHLKQRAQPASDAQIIASKGKLSVLSNTRDKLWKGQFQPFSYCGPNGNGIGYGTDVGTMQKVKEVLTSTYAPHLMLINLLGVDVYGHANQWNKYVENIQLTDQYALEIWRMIQENPATKDKTTLFITNDHGRHTQGHKSGFINHGDGCEGCRHISLLVLGPDIPKNKVVDSKAEMIDIPTTIAQMMHLDFPTGKGKFLEGLFFDHR
jgi:hypothetical protein